MKNLLAIDLFPPGGLRGYGPLGLEGESAYTAPHIFNNFISSVIGVITTIAFIWFIFVFITGAVSIIGSGGDKGAMETAKKKLTTGIIGLVVTIAAVFIISLIGKLLGIDLILNPAQLIIQLLNVV
jgi:hypothetical protein